MEHVDAYIASHTLQRRDAKDILAEYSNELAEMHGKWIDIGCGPGTVTKELILPKLPMDSVIVGSDISTKMLEKAQEICKNEKRISFLELNIETDNLPIDEKGKYDYALSFYCLHWCKNLRLVFQNIYELLRPGGRALIMFLSYNNTFEAYQKLGNNPRYEQYMQDLDKYIPYFQYCPDADAMMKGILEEVGFEVLDCNNKKKIFIFESEKIFENHVISINPFLPKIPDELKEEYTNETIKEIEAHKIMYRSVSDEPHEYCVVDRYKLMVAHFRKPNGKLTSIKR